MGLIFIDRCPDPFYDGFESDFANVEHHSYRTYEENHGRREQREYHVMSLPEGFAEQHALEQRLDSPLLGVVPAAEARPAIEVWLARRLRRDLAATPPGAIQWFPPAEIVGRVGSPVLREPVTLAALAVAARSELVPEWSAAPPQSAELPSDDGSRMTLSELRVPLLRARALEATAPAPEQFINAHLSSLEFTARVLALAEDPSTPLFERLRYRSHAAND